ncbi:MAG TPA: alpha/beta fold hydrolase [Solirubrobacterales bacterium]|jgi:pimeloyl-ACP methyl ester carboxylesterase|nr:alpha/beta fold hydrolase [Solirubrobacterales bacterium]
MGRRWKIAVGVVVIVVALLGLNALTIDDETKPAEVTVPDGRILSLPGGDLQVVEKGPRGASPIVLIHCFSCAIDWWDGMMPLLDRTHRVIAVDLLGHGGSEKPASGYSIPNQADVVAQALKRLGVRDAVVAGHSLGGTVAVALAERSPRLVKKLMIIDTPPNHSRSSLGLVAKLGFTPVIGEFFWRIKPDFAVKKGLEVAFAPGFDVPDAFVEDVDRMTFTAYDDSPAASDDYSKEEPLDQRVKESGKPLLVIMGAEEQIVDNPAERLAEYRRTVAGAQTKLIAGAGHSPNVEKPAETAALLLRFAKTPVKGVGSSTRGGVVSQHGTERRQGHSSQGKPNSGARPRSRASGVRGAAAQQ